MTASSTPKAPGCADVCEVLDWLTERHPQLAATAERDRQWLWITENLSGPSHEAVRAEIKAIGFRFAKRGHPLPSGATGTWAHHGDRPLPYRRRALRTDPDRSEWVRLAQEAGLSVEQLRAALA